MRPMMIARMLPWIGGVATLLLALVFRSPLFLPWRAIAMVWLSTATCIIVGGFITRLRRRHQRLSGGAILLWLTGCLIAAGQQGGHLWHKHAVLSAQDEVARRLGAHLVVGEVVHV